MNLSRIIPISGIIVILIFIGANTYSSFVLKDYQWFIGLGLDLFVLIPMFMFWKILSVSIEAEKNLYKEEFINPIHGKVSDWKKGSIMTNTIDILNDQWKNFKLNNSYAIRVREGILHFDLSPQNSSFEIILYNDVVHNAVGILYSEFFKRGRMVKFRVEDDMINLIDKDLINISKIFACDETLSTGIMRSLDGEETLILTNYIFELYTNNRIMVNTENHICIDSMDLVNMYIDKNPLVDKNSIPSGLNYYYIMDLLSKEKNIKF